MRSARPGAVTSHSQTVSTRHPSCSSALRASESRRTFSGQLRTPILLIRRWLSASATTIMSVPEATVNEDDGVILREDQVRCSREVASVKAEAITESVDETSDGEFRMSIRGLDARHDCASLGG